MDDLSEMFSGKQKTEKLSNVSNVLHKIIKEYDINCCFFCLDHNLLGITMFNYLKWTGLDPNRCCIRKKADFMDTKSFSSHKDRFIILEFIARYLSKVLAVNSLKIYGMHKDFFDNFNKENKDNFYKSIDVDKFKKIADIDIPEFSSVKEKVIKTFNHKIKIESNINNAKIASEKILISLKEYDVSFFLIVFNETNIYESFYFPEWTGFKIDTHDNYYINGQVMDDPECLMGLDFYLTSTFFMASLSTYSSLFENLSNDINKLLTNDLMKSYNIIN